MLYENLNDVVPLSCSSYEKILTRDYLKIGYDIDSKCLVLGRLEKKFSHQQNKSNDDDNEENETENQMKRNLIKFNDENYPEEFKSIIKRFEEYLKTSNHPARSGLSYYNKAWNWYQIELRKSNFDSKIMMIVEFNPQNLSKQDIETEMNNIEYHFSQGSGEDANLGSLYFHILNPLKEIDNDNTIYHLISGEPYLINKIDSQVFKFYAQNYYPDIFEVYEKLNKTLAKQIEISNKTSKTDIVIEIDGTNGVLASLSKSSCKKYYSIQQLKQTLPASIENASENENYFKAFFRFNKANMHLKNIFKENDSNSRVCVVIQNFDKSIVNFESKAKRDLIVKLRKYPQVKTILLVLNLNNRFKIEKFCYDLMTGERTNQAIFGNPFKATESVLIDSKPNSLNCIAVIRMERD